MNELNNKVMKLAILAGAFLSISTVEATRSKARRQTLLARQMGVSLNNSDQVMEIYPSSHAGAFIVIKENAQNSPDQSSQPHALLRDPSANTAIYTPARSSTK